MLRRVLVLCLCLCWIAPVFAQDPTVVTYDGVINNDTPRIDYPLTLAPGEAVLITADARRGDLDTLVELTDADGQMVASNDDRTPDNLDSALGYLSVDGGAYTVTITRYDGERGSSYGDFRLTITTGNPSILTQLDELTGIELSGRRLTRDTEHFRVHYTLTGSDRATEEFVEAVAHAVEEFYRIEIIELGWAAPPSDGYMGGDARYDVYLRDLIGSGEGALGYASQRLLVGDNPNSPEVETHAYASLIALDNDYADTASDSSPTQLSLMRATFAHEFHHAIQFGYDARDPHGWFYEASAVWMETKAAGKEQDATGYVEYAYQYPELCFGTDTDPRGGLMYGEWTFMQMLEDDFGDGAVLDLWRNIAFQDGFAALGEMLSAGGDNVPSAVARYRLKNLARDYELAPLFNATVWRENVISDLGRWTYTGRGIQELGANYFELALPAGSYYIGMINDGGALEVWAIGVTREGDSDIKLEAIPLGRGGTFDTTGYDHTYLMVFNPVYDEDVSVCRYYDYDIDVTPAKSARNLPLYSFDARFFEPLG